MKKIARLVVRRVTRSRTHDRVSPPRDAGRRGATRPAHAGDPRARVHRIARPHTTASSKRWAERRELRVPWPPCRPLACRRRRIEKHLGLPCRFRRPSARVGALLAARRGQNSAGERLPRLLTRFVLRHARRRAARDSRGRPSRSRCAAPAQSAGSLRHHGRQRRASWQSEQRRHGVRSWRRLSPWPPAGRVEESVPSEAKAVRS